MHRNWGIRHFRRGELPGASLLLSLGLATTLLIQTAPAQAQVNFAPVQNLVDRDENVALVLGDFDNDGDLDIVTAPEGSSNDCCLSRFTNGGAANSGSPDTLPLPGANRNLALVAGDLNGDGDLDLVTSSYALYSYGFGTLGVLENRGKGSGTFAVRLNQYRSAPPVSITLGDLDGDGDLDLAGVSGFGYSARLAIVVPNRGRRYFAGRGGERLPLVNPYEIASGDLDGDGDLDLVAINSYPSEVAVLRNRSNGTFAPAQYFPAVQGGRQIAVGDLDGDGDLDLVTGGVGGVVVLSNLGDGTFSAGLPVATSATSDVAVADLNGDGALDILYTGSAASFDAVTVLVNNGNGGFLAPVSFAVASPSALAVGDLDNDGDLDVVTASAFNPYVGVLLNTTATARSTRSRRSG